MANWQDQVAGFKREMKVEGPKISIQAIRFGFFGSVGGGKSVTAGIFAVGITPEGLIGWVDGEGHRSGFAIDVVAGMAALRYGGTKAAWQDRFRVIHIDPPFNPLRVVAAMEALEELGCRTINLDILSQAWDSDGGYLDLKNEELDRMAGDDEQKRRRAMASAAAHVKPWTHGKLVNKITHSKTNLVLLFQAKQKFNAKTSKPDDFQSPIQESGLTRTALAVGRVQANDAGEGGYCSFRLPSEQGTKYTHPELINSLPKNGERFTFEHAEAVLKFCGGTPANVGGSSNTSVSALGGQSGVIGPAAAASSPETPTTRPLETEGRDAGKPASASPVATAKTRAWMIEQLDDVPQFLEWAISAGWLMPNETLADISLNKVPTSAVGIRALREEIKKWTGKA